MWPPAGSRSSSTSTLPPAARGLGSGEHPPPRSSPVFPAFIRRPDDILNTGGRSPPPGHRRPRGARPNMLCARAPLPAESLEGWPLAAHPQRQRADPALRPPHRALSCSSSPDERRCVLPCSPGSYLACVALPAVTAPLTAECTNSVGRVDLRVQTADARSARRAERTRSAQGSGRCSESGSRGPRRDRPARGRYFMT